MNYEVIQVITDIISGKSTTVTNRFTDYDKASYNVDDMHDKLLARNGDSVLDDDYHPNEEGYITRIGDAQFEMYMREVD